MSVIFTLFRKIILKINRSVKKIDGFSDMGVLTKRRAAVINALNKSIEIFSSLKEDTFNKVMTNGIWPIADAVGLDRVVFYAIVNREGEKRFGQIYRWDKSEGGLMFLTDELKVLQNNPVIKKWLSIILKGGCIRLKETDYSEDEAAVLRVYGIKSYLLLPVSIHGELWGGVAFQNHTNGQYFDEDCADLLYTAARVFSNAIIKTDTERRAEEAIKALERREKMAAALNMAAVKFLSQSEASFEDTMTAGVKEIADVFNLDRFSVFRNFIKDNILHISQIYRWNRESGTTAPTKELVGVTYAHLVPSWEKILASGETMNGPARLLPEKAVLQSFGVVSAFITPVFINNIFWGFAILEDLHTERVFEEDCVDMMRSAAFLCANTVIRADMEREIANANEFTRAVLDASPLNFSVIDENGRFIDCNNATLDAFKTTKKYYIEHFSEFSPEYQSDGAKSADKAIELINRAIKGEKLVYEWMHRATTGELIPFEVTLTRTMYNGKYVVMGYQYDLSNIKKMEKNIREQSELLKVRLEQHELISKILRGFISSGDSEMLVKEAIAKLGQYHKVSLVFIFAMDYQRNNTYLAYHWTADGAPPQLAASKQFEYLKSAFPESLPSDAAIPIVYCDDTATSLDAIFYTLWTINVRAVIAAPLYVDGRLWGVISVRQRSTPRQWTEDEKEFVAMTASTIAGVIMRDIYNTRLTDALHKATAASKAKSEFLSNMSHEMRTPLNAITGMTTIGRNAKEMERKDYALKKIEDASTHLLGVINDVLDMSKIEANMLELSPVEFNFEKMLQKVIAVINFRVDEKRQKLTVHIDKEIPRTLIADDQRLAQVVTNLLSNAVKFTAEEGTITLDTLFKGEKDGLCAIQVSVSDTGIGISGEQQKYLFNSFQQAESSTTRKYGGTGLGLAISKSIVEMMGGAIWIESEAGKGSVFTFTVQARRGTGIIDEYPEAGKHEESRNITGIFAGRRILLVEDVEINREIVLSLLEPTKLEIDCAKNGVEAVRMFAAAPDKYGMIFMDIQMPEMDGYEATKQIRAIEEELKSNTLKDGSASFTEGETRSYYGDLRKKIPIIAMTANVFKEDIEKCLAAGMDSHVGKPINLEEVINRLHLYLD